MIFGDFTAKLFLQNNFLDRMNDLEDFARMPSDRGRLMTELAVLMPDIGANNILFGDYYHANKITSNPSFETGDFTGWTVSGAGYAVGTESFDGTLPHDGVYLAYYNTSSSLTTYTLTLDKYAVTEGLNYKFGLAFGFKGMENGIIVTIRWFDAGSTLLQTDTMFSYTGSANSGMSKKFSVLTAPSDATQAEIKVTTYNNGSGVTEFYVDDASIEELTETA